MSLLLEQLGFIMQSDNIGITEYTLIVDDSLIIEIVNLDELFSISFYQNENKTIVANRYSCHTIKELEFLLYNGRVGSILQANN